MFFFPLLTRRGQGCRIVLLHWGGVRYLSPFFLCLAFLFAIGKWRDIFFFLHRTNPPKFSFFSRLRGVDPFLLLLFLPLRGTFFFPPLLRACPSPYKVRFFRLFPKPSPPSSPFTSLFPPQKRFVSLHFLYLGDF